MILEDKKYGYEQKLSYQSFLFNCLLRFALMISY